MEKSMKIHENPLNHYNNSLYNQAGYFTRNRASADKRRSSAGVDSGLPARPARPAASNEKPSGDGKTAMEHADL